MYLNLHTIKSIAIYASNGSVAKTDTNIAVKTGESRTYSNLAPDTYTVKALIVKLPASKLETKNNVKVQSGKSTTVTFK